MDEIRPRLCGDTDSWRRLIRVARTLTPAEALKRLDGELPLSEAPDAEGLELRSVWQSGDGSWLRSYRRKEAELPDLIPDLVDALFEKYNSYTPGKIIYPQDAEGLAIVNLYDAHLDKIAYTSTDDPTGGFKSNLEAFSAVVARIAAHLKNEAVERILFPVGNDLYHTNDFGANGTKRGTRMEYHLEPHFAYARINDALLEAIITLSQVAPVTVIPVKSNHDEDKVRVLGYWLSKLYDGNDSVRVVDNRDQRFYYRYHDCLLGFAHGDKEKKSIAQLPLKMATEAREAWGNTTHRKFYLGDLHHGFEYNFLRAKDYSGCDVEYLRSVGTDDSYHVDFGWVGVPRTAYAQIFHPNDGEVSRRKFLIRED